MLMEQEGELCVCELMAALNESQPKVSRHLANLRTAGLLSDRRQGQWVFYQINPQLPQWARRVLSETCQANRSFTAQQVEQLCQMGQRPQRLQTCC